MTAGAIALLSVPVVALAKGPPAVVGGGNETAKSVAAPQANIPDTNAGQAKKPEPLAKPVAPPRAPKQTPPGHAKQADQVSAPAGGGNGSAAPGPAKKSEPHASPPAHAKAYGHGTSPGHAKRRSREPVEGSSDPVAVNEPAPADSPERPSRPDSRDKVVGTGPIELPPAAAPESSGTEGAALGAVVSDTVELPDDASPETLPFTGIQLGLLALIGLTSLAGGFALRRSTT